MVNDRNDGSPTSPGRAPAPAATRAEIDAFLAKVKGLAPTTEPGRRGRLIFALDATMSRQPMWDIACRLQADMFREAAAIGGLDVQLVYYRGLAECRASRWVSQAERLGGPDGADRLPRRPHPDRQGHRPCQARDPGHQGAGVGLRRRRHGGEARRSLPRRRRARSARECPPSCSRRATIRSPSRRFARSRG